LSDEGIVLIRSAVVSVSDKTGLVDFAKGLRGFGVKLMATDGTHSALREAGIEAVSLQDDMKLPSALSGRVKTLHAPLHAAILAKGTEEHRKELADMGVSPVDAVICNFYPFSEAAKKGVSTDEQVEQIDIGGPTMVRAASKNFGRVLVVPSPDFYGEVIGEMSRTGGGTTLGFRRRLAVEAFRRTSAYDATIFNNLGDGKPDAFPESFTLSALKMMDAKYGENPGTRARIYSVNGWETMAQWKQLAGDEMSFNNVLDVGSAFPMVEGFDQPAVATVKHGQISGFAFAPEIAQAYTLAHSCDPEADFGGCVVANRPLGVDAARLIGKNEGKDDGSVYTEIVMAPGFTDRALEIFKSKQKKKIRVIQTGARTNYPYDVKVLQGVVLVQEAVDYRVKLDRSVVTIPTKGRPDRAELEKLFAAWEVVRRVQSNGIVVADGSLESGALTRFWTLGIASFRKRNGAVKIALENAGARANGAVCASDGFFPFRDSVELLGSSGVSAVIQPGGSARDEDSVKAADAHGMAMVLTHMRAFRH
jgi:phosphoribosylaminoimidazolecarboxamide formyltransferase/IMP cyclohydrolase